MASTQASPAVDSRPRSGPRCPGCQERDAQIRELQELVGNLRRRLRHCQRELQQQRERSGRNSTNSSIPPSRNPVDAPRPQTSKKPSGRSRGAQPNHPPTNPGLVPLEELTEPPTVCLPETCAQCQAPLSGTDPYPQCHQVIELPPLTPEICEYQRHSLSCACCGHSTLAPLPEGVPTSNYGPRLHAFIALCTGCYHLSKRQAEELLTTTFNIPISLGSICNIEHRVSDALDEPVAEAKRFVQHADVVHGDETSWPQQPHKGWLWVAATTCLAVFSIRNLRDRASAEHLLGLDFAGVLVSDRFSSYNWVRRRQLCWAHLRRDWQAFIDRGGSSRRLGRKLRKLTDHMYHLWHRVRDGTLSRPRFRFHMRAIRRQVGDCLRAGLRCAHTRTAGTCAAILEHEEQLWTFVTVPNVEPTNNAAERIVRQAVLWRKKSFGTRSRRGSRYVERLLTVVATCRLQGRDVLEYLSAACAAATHQRPAPSLLPLANY